MSAKILPFAPLPPKPVRVPAGPRAENLRLVCDSPLVNTDNGMPSDAAYHQCAVDNDPE
jgi:hypothetical protein